MPERSPKHGLTRVLRHPRGGGPPVHAGWSKRINGKPKWICGAAVAPTGATADLYYELHFAELWETASAPPPEPEPASIDLGALAGYFLDRKARAELSPRTVAEYRDAVQEFIDVVGDERRPSDLSPADFAKVRLAWASRFGPDRLAKFVIMIRTMFKWGQQPPLRLAAPEYGDEFDVPTKLAFKRDRAAKRQAHGLKLFDAAELRTLLRKSPPKQRAMILLALNGGLGNTDIGELPLAVVDLVSGWVDYTRGKTGNDRRFPLWPETAAAVRVAVAMRSKMFAKWAKVGRAVDPSVLLLLFVTRQGQPYVLDTPSRSEGERPLHKDRVAGEFYRVCKTAGLLRHGRNFYSLRRTHRTLADEVGDQRAAALVMGHEVGDMGGVYVQRISDERLKRITDHIRTSLAVALRGMGPVRPPVLKRAGPRVATGRRRSA